MKKKKFYVTTAIAYPNSSPHCGHALEAIQADVVARFHRLLGKDVFFQTGTDEHGVKNWQTAKKEGKDIREFLDSNVAVFKKLYKKLNISYDNFIRTTDKKRHHPGAKKLWKELVKRGDIYKKHYKGLYCAGCEAFKTEKELYEGKCPNHPTKEIETIEEENYFFRLSRYKDEIARRINLDRYNVIPDIRKNEILSWLKDAKDISFSRPKTSLPWGIPVPDDEKQVMYVWCDALSNYITGAGYGRDEKGFKDIWPADIHIIGKDILRFHAAFWPAMLISARIPLPKQLFVHGFILSKGAKMSKSTGNVIEPFEQIGKYGVEQFRFYVIGAMPLGEDGEYSEELVEERINSELVGNLSNFCYRVLSFTNKNFESRIKGVEKSDVIDEIRERFDVIKDAYLNYDFKKAVDEIMSVSALGNKYFQDKEPWKLIKEDKGRAHEVIGTCLNIVKNLSILLYPAMPGFCSELRKQIKLKELKWKDLNFSLKNHKIGKAEILMRKVEKREEEKFPLDLRIARIEKVSDHPEADRLYVLDLDVGEKRRIVAGIKDFYDKKELEGKKIVIAANLKPAKIRGVVSKGMLLAAEKGKECRVLFVEGDIGKEVRFGNLRNDNKEVSYEAFSKLKMSIKDGKVVYDGKALNVNGKDVKVEIGDGARIC
ncbi:methionine--tRNA ligase [Candidatus Woesearchaeota archaeon]|nr:methionine--tRNA ligase [Candidatus Woesearchaeota archaeon]